MSEVSSGRVSLAIEGLSKLRTASILMTVSYIIVFAGVAIAVISVLSALSGFFTHPKAFGPRMGPEVAWHALSVVMPAMVGLAILGFVGFIMMLVALFAYLVPGFSRLSDFDSSAFGTPSTLIKVGYVGGAISFALGFLIMLGGALAKSIGAVFGGLALLVIGFILLIIGDVGIIVGCFRLKEAFGVSLFLVAGVLFIVSIVLYFVPRAQLVALALDFVAWILMYVATGSAISKLRQSAQVSA